MKASICIATHNKPSYLDRVLNSIFQQEVPFEFEVIVVDDGSTTDDTQEVCSGYNLQCVRLPQKNVYGNPAKARNCAYKLATGEVIISQSDDVVHTKRDTIFQLVNSLQEGHFVIASVFNTDLQGNLYGDIEGIGYGDKLKVYTSPERRRPLFFLGSLYRKDLYAVGGNDEEFTAPSREDVWFGLCLTRGLGLKPIYSSEIVGHHLHHQHCLESDTTKSKHLFEAKLRKANSGQTPFESIGGPWPF